MFALWISKLLQDATPFELAVTHGRAKSGLKKFGVYSWAPCRECNIGWMSALEQDAAPVLRAVILGHPTEWTVDEQGVVARWAFKTALMLDRSNLIARRVPADHFAYLHDHSEIPSAAQVAVGAYRPTPGELALGATGGVGSGPATHRQSYRVAFSVGRVVFQIDGYSGSGSGFAVQPFAQHTSALIVPMWNSFPTIWPRLSSTFQWPPPDGFAVDNNGLLKLTDDPVMEPLSFGRTAI